MNRLSMYQADWQSAEYSGTLFGMDAGYEPDKSIVKVSLEKIDGKFGFAYRSRGMSANEGLVITGVVPEGALDMWNEASDADYDITVGDVVVSVNDMVCTLGGKALVQEMQQCDRCVLTIKKKGPRWHMFGVTAECMEKISHAKEQGMTLEFVATTKVVEDQKIEEQRSLSYIQFALIALAVVAPYVVLVALFSEMGVGLAFYSFFAPKIMNMGGNFIIFIGTVIFLALYLGDWQEWKSKAQKVGSALILIYTLCLGAVIKCRFYPYAPLVITLFHLPVFLGVVRTSSLKQVQRAHFYKGVFSATGVISLALLLVWILWMCVDSWGGNNMWNDATKARLVQKSANMYAETRVKFETINCEPRTRSLVYDWDCSEDPSPFDFDVVYGDLEQSECKFTAADKGIRAKQCGTIKSVWFLVWLSPFIAAVCGLVISAFSFLNGVLIDLSDTTRAEKVLKQFILMVAVMLLGMWVSASIAGASMRLTGALMAFLGAGIIAMSIWAFLEVGQRTIASTLSNSRIMLSIVAIVTSDWARAMFVICFNVMLPSMLVIEAMRQKVRKLRQATESTDCLTDEAYRVLDKVSNWNWASIFMKVNWLVILYWTLSIGVAKITYVFLSWLNGMFAENVPFTSVVVIFFFIGYTMFLLPPVPGIPVYITSGIIIASQARHTVLGFYGGIGLAIGVSFVLKMAAVCGQYMIGYFMGKSVKIQQLVSVDKVFTRSIERILLQRGLGFAKVSVLVGGPDWPTSVLCGILRLNILQCLLGTVPVILVSSPCVLAGAFMAGPEDDLTDGEKSMWDALANSALALSALGQLGSGILAMYYIQKTMHENQEELAKPRPEHEKVLLLTIKERDYILCYQEGIEWGCLSLCWRLVMVLSVSLMLFCLFLFNLMDELCFKSFQVKDKIDTPKEEGGLGVDRSDFSGAAIALVKPFGWLALGLFAVACALHFLFVWHAARQAKAILREKVSRGELGDNGEAAAAAVAAASLEALPDDGFAPADSGGGALREVDGVATILGRVAPTTPADGAGLAKADIQVDVEN